MNEKIAELLLPPYHTNVWEVCPKKSYCYIYIYLGQQLYKQDLIILLNDPTIESEYFIEKNRTILVVTLLISWKRNTDVAKEPEVQKIHRWENTRVIHTVMLLGGSIWFDFLPNQIHLRNSSDNLQLHVYQTKMKPHRSRERYLHVLKVSAMHISPILYTHTHWL